MLRWMDARRCSSFIADAGNPYVCARRGSGHTRNVTSRASSPRAFSSPSTRSARYTVRDRAFNTRKAPRTERGAVDGDRARGQLSWARSAGVSARSQDAVAGVRPCMDTHDRGSTARGVDWNSADVKPRMAAATSSVIDAGTDASQDGRGREPTSAVGPPSARADRSARSNDASTTAATATWRSEFCRNVAEEPTSALAHAASVAACNKPPPHAATSVSETQGWANAEGGRAGSDAPGTISIFTADARCLRNDGNSTANRSPTKTRASASCSSSAVTDAPPTPVHASCTPRSTVASFNFSLVCAPADRTWTA